MTADATMNEAERRVLRTLQATLLAGLDPVPMVVARQEGKDVGVLLISDKGSSWEDVSLFVSATTPTEVVLGADVFVGSNLNPRPSEDPTSRDALIVVRVAPPDRSRLWCVEYHRDDQGTIHFESPEPPVVVGPESPLVRAVVDGLAVPFHDPFRRTLVLGHLITNHTVHLQCFVCSHSHLGGHKNCKCSVFQPKRQCCTLSEGHSGPHVTSRNSLRNPLILP